MDNKQNVRSKMDLTEDKSPIVELRKHWDVREASYIYAVYARYIEETAATTGTGKHIVPDWNKIVKRQYVWGPLIAQGGAGDEEWAKKTAEHFNIVVPTNEYKGEHDEPEDIK